MMMMMESRTTKYGTDTVMVMSDSHNEDEKRKPAGANVSNLLGVATCFLCIVGGYALMTLHHGANFLISSSSSSSTSSSIVEDDPSSIIVTPFDLHHASSSSSGRRGTLDRSILLLRHAKSSWENYNNNASNSNSSSVLLDDVFDAQRPLLARGVQDAKRLGRYLEKHRIPVPDIIYSSPSVRTRQTLHLVQKHWASNVPVQYMHELYDDEIVSLSYIDLCRSLNPTYHRVLLVGHNPAIQTTAIQLVGEVSSDSSLFEELFPTAGLVEIEFRNDDEDHHGDAADTDKGWDYVVDQSNGRVAMFVTPSMT